VAKTAAKIAAAKAAKKAEAEEIAINLMLMIQKKKETKNTD
jgi:hypothetical protein